MDKSTVICSPYTPSCEYRALSRYVTDQMYRDIGYSVYYGTSSANNFNRSAAKNVAVYQALEDNQTADVIVLSDSDTFVSAECLQDGIDLCRKTGRIVNPFTEYKWVTHNCSLRTAVERVEEFDTYLDFKNHVGGIVIVPVELFKKVGGYDERFESWGGEDRAFYFACNAVLGYTEGLRVEGVAYHLYHPRGMDTLKTDPRNESVVKLGMRYKVASGVKRISGILRHTESDKIDIHEMIMIMSENRGPLSDTKCCSGRMCTSEELNKSVSVIKRLSDGKLKLSFSNDETNTRIKNDNSWIEVLCT